jgi:hypothetical protein
MLAVSCATADCEKWQGVHWPRFCRAGTAIGLLLGIGLSCCAIHQVSRRWGGLLFAVIVFALMELAFVRRMGIEIGPDGLLLRGAVRKIHIPWSSIHGLQWRKVRRSMSRTMFLYVETDQRTPRRIPADAPIRVPTSPLHLNRPFRMIVYWARCLRHAGSEDLMNRKLMWRSSWSECIPKIFRSSASQRRIPFFPQSGLLEFEGMLVSGAMRSSAI